MLDNSLKILISNDQNKYEDKMSPRSDAIAEAVIECFSRLPAKRKPAVRDNGLHEWVPLSGIVAEVEGKFACISMA